MGDGLSKSDESEDSQGGLTAMAPWLWRSGRPSDTVIIFDWDDTLLCSSAMNWQQCEPGQLQQLEATVEQVISKAMDLGDTFIVTNGNGTWVQESSRMWLPKVVPLLNRLKKIVSARATYEHIWPGDPFAWKKAAFEVILRDRQAKGGSHFSSGGVNLLSFGDNQAEIDAAHTATASLSGSSVIKTVKFKDTPSVDELLGQLRLLVQILPDLVNAESNQSNALVPRSNCREQAHLAYLTSWASGWRVAPHRPGVQLDTTSQSPLRLPMQQQQQQQHSSVSFTQVAY